jgi:hypothetical protein
MTTWQGIHRIHNNDDQEVKIALRELQGCDKTLSILYLHMLGLPVLDGFISTSWKPAFESYLHQFCSEIGIDSFLVRTDKRKEVFGTTPRGGYIIPAKAAVQTVCNILARGRVAILLEPVSPYEDLYSINALFDKEDDILLEIVGPGFDASDLQRGDITPHQIIELVNVRRVTAPNLGLLDIRQKHIVSNQEYRQSVLVRLEKIGKRLKGLPITQKVSPDEKQLLIKVARDYLKSTGKTLLLKHEQEYNPIPLYYLRQIYGYICNLPERLSRVAGTSKTFVASTSIFESGLLNFWDIFWPDRKYVPMQANHSIAESHMLTEA